jgi:hypothetical protein
MLQWCVELTSGFFCENEREESGKLHAALPRQKHRGNPRRWPLQKEEKVVVVSRVSDEQWLI